MNARIPPSHQTSRPPSRPPSHPQGLPPDPVPLVAISACRSCGAGDLREVLAFGATPIADRLVRPDDPGPDPEAPLTLLHCPACGLCQIRETVAPRVLFGPEYPYFSSVSPALTAHFRDAAAAIVARRGLGPGHLVVEAASNDGCMLLPFRDRGIGTLGIDPADGPVAAARAKGIETVHDFFGLALARRLAAEGRRADVFLANNVLAHVADTNDFVAGIATILAPGGVAVIECPYLPDLLDHGAFDTIYHQHLLYLSLTALVPLFARHGLVLNDAARLKVHGGSLRLEVSRAGGQTPGLAALLAAEARRGLADAGFAAPFRARVARMRAETRAALARMRAEGLRVAGYGAAAKATTLLHHFGLGRDDLTEIFDKSPWKAGLAMPGCRIPIRPAEEMTRDRADAVLILAWNFANEIVAANAPFLAAGGRFLVPVPGMRIVAADAPGVSL